MACVGRNNFCIRITEAFILFKGSNYFLADGKTWDSSWYTDQDRHPEEKVKTWKHRVSAERRAEQLRANGVSCRVAMVGEKA